MASGRLLNYCEFVGPCQTPDEQQLFHDWRHSTAATRGEG